MPSLKDIRTRIDSTKNTQQITKAMKMVSAAKLRRAQQNIVNLRPYANTILSVISDIALTHRIDHPLLSSSRDVKKVLLVVVTSDRGLCGAFNTNVLKFAHNYISEVGPTVDKLDLIVIGKKAIDFFKRRGVDPKDVKLNLAKDVSYVYSAKISEDLMGWYETGEYDEIRFVYNEFKSAIQQKVVSETILPVDVQAAATINKGINGFPQDMLFEPQPEEIIDDLLKKHFAVQVYRCLSESVAAEHGARMAAMENATKNAGEMINKLTLNYNKARQAAITTELIEITSGAEALKG